MHQLVDPGRTGWTQMQLLRDVARVYCVVFTFSPAQRGQKEVQVARPASTGQVCEALPRFISVSLYGTPSCENAHRSAYHFAGGVTLGASLRIQSLAPQKVAPPTRARDNRRRGSLLARRDR